MTGPDDASGFDVTETTDVATEGSTAIAIAPGDATDSAGDTPDAAIDSPPPPTPARPQHLANVEASELRQLLAEVAGLHAGGMPLNEAARVVGVDVRGRKLPATFGFTPTPAEIEAGCAEIRARWDDAEFARRSSLKVVRWEPVTVATAMLVA